MKNGFRVMDSDLHTMEPDGLWERYLDEPFKRFAPKFIRGTDHAPNQPIIKIGALDIGEMSKRPRTAVVGKDLQRRAFARSPHYDVAHARGYDAASHVQAMDIEGIDVAILYGTRGRQVLMHDDLDPLVADALARAHNNWTYDYCQHAPGRLKFAAQVGFHPTGQSSLRDDIARRYLDHPNGRVIGVAGRNPVELMFAFASMAAGGVLERHPRLRCAFLEGTCGWLPWWLWRLDEAWEKFGPGSEVQISGLPSEYFYRQCYIATDADERVLRQVVEAIGDDNIVVSTDYPHSDGLFPEAINEFVALEGVSAKTKAKILWDNCARLYPLASG